MDAADLRFNTSNYLFYFYFFFPAWTHTGDTIPVITTHIIQNFQGPEAVEQSARGDEINRVTFLFLFFSLFLPGGPT